MASIVIVDGLDLASIRLFLAVVELGSVSKAAARHHIAQPSATARLQKLERQLGVELLDRGPTGSQATTDGVRLAPACSELLAAAASLVDRADQLRDEQAHLPIAATRHVVDHFLAAWIADAQLSDVRIDVDEADTLRVAQAVRAGEAVLGFTEGPGAPVGLRSELVGTEQLHPVVGRTHPWFGRRRGVGPAELASATLVLPARGSGARDVVDAALAQHELGGVGEHVEVQSQAAARLAALNGAGIAFLPACRIERDVEHRMLGIVPVRGTRIEQPVRVVWRGARPSSRAARRLLDTIVVG
jgi:DNA-binding transcriptional LysR family regulator